MYGVWLTFPEKIPRERSRRRTGKAWLAMLFLAAVILSFQVAVQQASIDEPFSVGVVWTQPESPILASAELEAMRALGITRIRTGSIDDQAVLAMADSLGLVFYRELPLVGFSARQLVDSTAFASRLLTRLLRAGQGHASAGPVGLAVGSDVSSPVACPYFSDVIRDQPADVQQEYYYVGAFVEDDACSDEVDFVMLDALDDTDPVSVLARWQASHEARAGLAAIGWWVDPDADAGIGIPHSNEEQARALERSIKSLASLPDAPVVFVHRWRDQTRRSGDAGSAWDLYGRHYGLNSVERQSRPSLDVLAGFLLRGQDVFAFPTAAASSFTFPWFILLGWTLILAVSILYASTPRFRYMLPRYFVAHGFFRNAVREAREVLPIVSTLLMSIMGIAVGQIGTQVFLGLHGTAPVRHVMGLLPVQAQSILIAMLDGPLLSVILIGSLALLAMAGWMGLWMIVASRKAPLLPSQALMLGVWPRWQLLLLLPMAMTIYTLPTESALGWTGLLMVLWIGSAFWATIRTAFDLFKITRCPTPAAIIVWCLNPLWIGFLVVLVMSFIHGDQVGFFWHLMTRN